MDILRFKSTSLPLVVHGCLPEIEKVLAIEMHNNPSPRFFLNYLETLLAKTLRLSD